MLLVNRPLTLEMPTRARCDSTAARGPTSSGPTIVTLRHGRHLNDGMLFYVQALWRYPVKSLAGEPVSMTTLGPDGVAGDRIVRVRGPEGVRTSRRHHRLLGLRGTLDADGRARINGHPWDSADSLALVKNAAGADAWIEAWQGLDRFDILPLLVATDGAVAAFGRDVRRLRPNIVVGGVEGLAEREWENAELHIGDSIVRLDLLRSRCHMTTIDPDTLQVNPNVLRDIVRRFDNKLALNGDVVRGGTIRVGDPVNLVQIRDSASELSGFRRG
jgi:MOSC domain-containing protein